MTDALALRPARRADAEQLARFNEHLALETEGLTLDPATVRAGVEKLLDRAELGFYLVIAHEQQLVASLLVTYEWSDWRCGQFWWIQSVYVATAYRRRGLYRRLYARVKQLARARGEVCGFRLYVEQDNHAAQATYQQAGMVATHYQLYEESIEATGGG